MTDINGTDLGAQRAAAARRGMLLGIPLGELGWFQSLLIATAAGFAAFFLATFCAIMVFLILMPSHPGLNFNITYRCFGLYTGLATLLLAYGYFGFQWFRRKLGR